MTREKVSGWQIASTIATCVQVVIVTISLSFIWSQVRQQKQQLEQQTRQVDQQTKLSRAANTQSLVNLLTPLNLRVTDRAMIELWVKGDCGISKVSDPNEQAIQREQYETLLASNMVFYENAFSQYRAGLLDQEVYDGWDKDLTNFIDERRIATHWTGWRDLYRKDFTERVNAIIASLGPPPPCPK